MLFYDCATAPNPRRARMFIAEKGLEIETRDVSIAKGEQLDATFLVVNPRATIPVLVTDQGAALTENLGIAAYLEAQFPEPPLMATVCTHLFPHAELGSEPCRFVISVLSPVLLFQGGRDAKLEFAFW